MSTVTAFLDTNVLVQFRPPDELDWCAILSSTSVELVLVPAVMRELEEMKVGDNKRLRKRATSALDQIERLLGDGLLAPVRANVTMRYQASEPSLDFKEVGLSAIIVDDWILAALMERGAEGVVLVTDDIGLALKAKGRGFRCVRPPADRRLPPDEDEEVKKLNEEVRLLRRQVGKRPRITLSFADGGSAMRCATPPANMRRASSASQVAAKKRELMLKVEHDQKLVEAERNSRFPGIHRSFGAFARPEFDQRELDRYLEQLRRHLESEEERFSLYQRSFLAVLTLANEGEAPAEGIEVRLNVPEGVAILDGQETESVPEPSLPKYFRSPFDAPNDHQALMRDIVSRSVLTNTPRPWGWYFDRDVRELRISASDLVHTGTRDLPSLRLTFPVVDGKSKGFHMSGSVLVSKPPDQTPVELHFVPVA